MTNDNMIARVAWAIAQSLGSTEWWLYSHTAQRAILAMRDPSSEFIQSAMPNLPPWDSLPEDWNKLIDHAASTIPLIAEINDCGKAG